MRLYWHEVEGSVPVLFDYYVEVDGVKVQRTKQLWGRVWNKE